MEPSAQYRPSAPPAPASVVFVAAQQPQLGPDPMIMTCPHCNAEITTNMEMIPSMKTHLFFVALCALGCCCCAPCAYCTDSCLAKKHTCPSCNHFIGVYNS